MSLGGVIGQISERHLGQRDRQTDRLVLIALLLKMRSFVIIPAVLAGVALAKKPPKMRQHRRQGIDHAGGTARIGDGPADRWRGDDGRGRRRLPGGLPCGCGALETPILANESFPCSPPHLVREPFTRAGNNGGRLLGPVVAYCAQTERGMTAPLGFRHAHFGIDRAMGGHRRRHPFDALAAILARWSRKASR